MYPLEYTKIHKTFIWIGKRHRMGGPPETAVKQAREDNHSADQREQPVQGGNFFHSLYYYKDVVPENRRSDGEA